MIKTIRCIPNYPHYPILFSLQRIYPINAQFCLFLISYILVLNLLGDQQSTFESNFLKGTYSVQSLEKIPNECTIYLPLFIGLFPIPSIHYFIYQETSNSILSQSFFRNIFCVVSRLYTQICTLSCIPLFQAYLLLVTITFNRIILHPGGGVQDVHPINTSAEQGAFILIV